MFAFIAVEAFYIDEMKLKKFMSESPIKSTILYYKSGTFGDFWTLIGSLYAIF